MKPVKTTVVLAATALCAGLMLPVVAAVPAAAGTNGCPPDSFYGIAHQGAHDDNNPPNIPRTWRNTLPAFQKANDRCQWVESDVRFTSDMIPVMVHDYTTKPMFRGRCNLVVEDHTLAELRAACRNPDGSSVATLDEYLDAVSVFGLVELKSGGSTSAVKVGIIIDKIYAHGDENVVALNFTKEWLLQRIAELDDDSKPVLRCWKGALVAFPDRVAAVADIALFSYAKFSGANGPTIVSRLTSRGVQSISAIGTKGANSRPAAWAYLASIGAAGAQTDYSLQMSNWQNSR